MLLNTSLEVSEIIHHYRACLDGLVYSALPDGCSEAQRGDSAFTIHAVQSKFKKLQKKQGGHLPISLRSYCRSLMPFVHSLGTGSPLFLLHELNRLDKHRILPLQVPALAPGLHPVKDDPSQTGFAFYLAFDDSCPAAAHMPVFRVLEDIDATVKEVITRFEAELRPR